MDYLTSNDELGGSGSISPSLWDVAVNGLSRTIDGELSKKYPLTSFNQNYAYTADGTPIYVGAPQQLQSGGARLGSLIKSPVGIAIGVSLLIGLVVLIASRR
jgi:hypothetical protein